MLSRDGQQRLPLQCGGVHGDPQVYQRPERFQLAVVTRPVGRAHSRVPRSEPNAVRSAQRDQLTERCVLACGSGVVNAGSSSERMELGEFRGRGRQRGREEAVQLSPVARGRRGEGRLHHEEERQATSTPPTWFKPKTLGQPILKVGFDLHWSVVFVCLLLLCCVVSWQAAGYVAELQRQRFRSSGRGSCSAQSPQANQDRRWVAICTAPRSFGHSHSTSSLASSRPRSHTYVSGHSRGRRHLAGC